MINLSINISIKKYSRIKTGRIAGKPLEIITPNNYSNIDYGVSNNGMVKVNNIGQSAAERLI